VERRVGVPKDLLVVEYKEAKMEKVPLLFSDQKTAIWLEKLVKIGGLID
jgi:hypothetical protein